ncbi:hypothetical protein, partial [Pseudomonas aeruginosa]|uniref:hypothetical protein n=1 Tax=Pseudomonas aeruginosa TaxID=287 RepID=UPI0019695863
EGGSCSIPSVLLKLSISSIFHIDAVNPCQGRSERRILAVTPVLERFFALFQTSMNTIGALRFPIEFPEQRMASRNEYLEPLP